MGRNRFVQPEVVRLPLSDGDWVEAKKQLSVGESRAAMQALVGKIDPDGNREPNYQMVGVAEVSAYLTAWSFVDASGKGVPLTMAAIQGLDRDSFDEIEAALKVHVEKMDAERAERKNVRSTSPASAATS